MPNLWSLNAPDRFWRFRPDPPSEVWQAAIWNAAHLLELPTPPSDLDDLLFQTLGEGRFGPRHWRLAPEKRLYYQVRPLLSRCLIDRLKQANAQAAQTHHPGLHWPIEDRYARFLWQVACQILTLTGQAELSYRRFWPQEQAYGLVITHDIEAAEGLAFVETLADLDESLGFRSSFNFVLEKYPFDPGLFTALRQRGFEIGLHGLKHDGKLFRSRRTFQQRARRINDYLRRYQAGGFRAPMTHRQPEWMQALQIDYDLSFFDTDPYEPMPGGTMSLWPFFIGHFVELPYTLIQDCCLTSVLGETSPRLWIEKVAFLKRYSGLALLNAHPDYLRDHRCLALYREFLLHLKDSGGYWNALPKEAAAWWRKRSDLDPSGSPFPIEYALFRTNTTE